MNNVNQQGLPRGIPLPIKRRVRQQCGFGCVICGCAIYQYEHVDPEFKDATEHDPSKIALLCGKCHDYVTRRIWPKEKVTEARGNPRCLQERFSRGAFAYGSNELIITLGTATFLLPRSILRVYGQEILAAAGPEEPGGPMRISGSFYNSDDTLLFALGDNEWCGPVEAWDIETEGPTITVRRGHRDIALQFTVEGSRILRIDRLDMFCSGLRVCADEHGVALGRPGTRAVGFSGRIRAGDCCIDVRKAGDIPAQGMMVVEGDEFAVAFGCGASCVSGSLLTSRTRTSKLILQR